jgi:hypothetical protein
VIASGLAGSAVAWPPIRMGTSLDVVVFVTGAVPRDSTNPDPRLGVRLRRAFVGVRMNLPGDLVEHARPQAPVHGRVRTDAPKNHANSWNAVE